ncbi:DUF6221 family protein [Fodinicola feengrottensis]|uniref:DUF6221 family protein n=1 Tax=Fodinicola feengrottensis TaxID=435914 RepID=UPI0013D08071|nr:DUF6221 family protein [Fodinicola feengrottensis]
MDIVDFVRARLDGAQIAERATPGPWVVCDGVIADYEENATWEQVVEQPVAPRDDTHIAANDPAYVLRDVAAKRAIVDACGYADESDSALFEAWRDAVSYLAAIDSAHPDYDPKWRR